MLLIEAMMDEVTNLPSKSMPNKLVYNGIQALDENMKTLKVCIQSNGNGQGFANFVKNLLVLAKIERLVECIL